MNKVLFCFLLKKINIIIIIIIIIIARTWDELYDITSLQNLFIMKHSLQSK